MTSEEKEKDTLSIGPPDQQKQDCLYNECS
jgi:hypothetical protein